MGEDRLGFSVSQKQYFSSNEAEFDIQAEHDGVMIVECVVSNTFPSYGNPLEVEIAIDGLTPLASLHGRMSSSDGVFRALTNKAVLQGVVKDQTYHIATRYVQGAYGNAPSFDWIGVIQPN